MITRKAIIIFILTVAIFLIATNVQAGWLFVIVAALLALLAVSFLFPMINVRNIEARLVTPPEVFEGETMPVQIDLLNRGRWPRYFFKLTGDLLDEPLSIGSLPPGKTARFNSPYRCSKRGFYQQASLSLRSGFPFGIFYRESKSSCPTNLLVYPTYTEISSFPLLEAASYPGDVLHERRAKGVGYDYLGIREYRPGDSLRAVHWRSSARRGQLIVKEFEEELSSTVSIVLDLEREQASETLERGVKVAASLAHYILDAGHPLQLFGQDGDEVETLFQPNFWQALEWLAKVEAKGRIPLSAALKKILPQLKSRSTCIIITPRTDVDYQDIFILLQDRRIRVVVVFLGSLSAEVSLPRRVAVYGCTEGEDIGECLSRPSIFTSG